VSAGDGAPPLESPAATRANLVLVLAFAWLWLLPLLQFWGAAWGPFRPHGYPPIDVAPSRLAFLLGLAACFVPVLLPTAYFRPWEGRNAARLYAALGVRAFTRVATNGDLVNRFLRRRSPGHRVVRDVRSALAWAEQARSAERHHLVFLLMGSLSAGYAQSIGWRGWAAVLAASNVVFNVYPILLQRYNRLRIDRACGASARQRADTSAGPPSSRLSTSR
jgi:hypothetical protein